MTCVGGGTRCHRDSAGKKASACARKSQLSGYFDGLFGRSMGHESEFGPSPPPGYGGSKERRRKRPRAKTTNTPTGEEVC